jgi:hypothetical protein
MTVSPSKVAFVVTMKNYERIRDIVSQLDPTDLVGIKSCAGEQRELSTIKKLDRSAKESRCHVYARLH